MGKNLGIAKSFRFSEAELELLAQCAKEHGSQRAALVAGLELLAGKNATNWPAELRRLALELEGKKKK